MTSAEMGILNQFLSRSCYRDMFRIRECVSDTIILDILANPGHTCVIRCPSPYPEVIPAWKITIGNRVLSCFHPNIPGRALTIRQCIIYCMFVIFIHFKRELPVGIFELDPQFYDEIKISFQAYIANLPD